MYKCCLWTHGFMLYRWSCLLFTLVCLAVNYAKHILIGWFAGYSVAFVLQQSIDVRQKNRFFLPKCPC